MVGVGVGFRTSCGREGKFPGGAQTIPRRFANTRQQNDAVDAGDAHGKAPMTVVVDWPGLNVGDTAQPSSADAQRHGAHFHSLF